MTHDLNKKLPAAIAEVYELTDKWVGGTKQLFGTGRTIDLEKLNVRNADFLVSIGKMKKKSSPATKKVASK